MGQVTLPANFGMSVSAGQIELENKMRATVYPDVTPGRFLYPENPYTPNAGIGGLSGFARNRGVGRLRGVRGMGQQCMGYDYYGFLQAWQVEDCGAAPNNSDPATQYACQLRNQPKLNAIALLAPAYGVCIQPSMLPAGYVPSSGSANDPSVNGSGGGLIYIGNGAGGTVVLPAPTTGGGTSTTPTNTNTPPPVYAPQVSFVASRAGTLYPGDTWQIHITGAAPNVTVQVDGTHAGQTNRNTMGTTDAQGNFLLSGTITADSVGSWQETWYAGGQTAGTFGFVVAAPATQTPPTGGGSSIPGGGSTPPPTGGGTSTVPGAGTSSTGGSAAPPTQTTTSDGTIMGIDQKYVLMGGAALILILAMGRH